MLFICYKNFNLKIVIKYVALYEEYYWTRVRIKENRPGFKTTKSRRTNNCI